MVTVGYSTRKHNPEFIEYLKISSGIKNIEVIEKINNGEKSLSQTYNEILSESNNNILILCHDDIYFDTKKWGEKIFKHFDKSDYGILGVAGTTYLPKSGQWWEDSSKMVGIVNHENNGKKWESKYSEDLGVKIQKTVIVDGLFIGINKNRIKCNFDESVKGFHFYDVNFCFKNFIKKVDIGVISNIRITHKSIGQTNQQWDDNRIKFSNEFEQELPSQISLNSNDNIKLLFFVKNPIDYISELQILSKSNKEIMVVSNNITKESVKILNKLRIKSFKENEIPGFKLGDGKSFIKTNEGVIKTEIGQYYKLNSVKFDLIFSDTFENFNNIKILYPYTPKIFRVIDETKIPQHDSLKKYLIDNVNISENSIIKLSDYSIYSPNNIENVILDTLNKLQDKTQKVKILTGFSERGGSTTALINLTNFFNKNGIDCTFYGPHQWHLDKCKSDLISNIQLDKSDKVITHAIRPETRLPVDTVVLSSHEKWWFQVGKIPQHWDKVIFLHEEHRKYHSDYNGEYDIIPNLKESLTSETKKPNVELIAGVIGTIEDRKQTHISIKRALEDGCEQILLFGKIADENYYNDFLKDLLIDPRIVLSGYQTDKQLMYDSIGRVYHSSKGEVACLVKDECYLTNTKFFGNEETEHEVSPLTNEEILNKWKIILKLN
jgi:hypothetical protein